jgi:hypothetical protein
MVILKISCKSGHYSQIQKRGIKTPETDLLGQKLLNAAVERHQMHPAVLLHSRSACATDVLGGSRQFARAMNVCW